MSKFIPQLLTDEQIGNSHLCVVIYNKFEVEGYSHILPKMIKPGFKGTVKKKNGSHYNGNSKVTTPKEGETSSIACQEHIDNFYKCTVAVHHVFTPKAEPLIR